MYINVSLEFCLANKNVYILFRLILISSEGKSDTNQRFKYKCWNIYIRAYRFKEDDMGRKGKELFDVFFRAKPANLLVGLSKQEGKNNYGSILAKDANCTYSHAVKILQDMEKAKLVSFQRNGRIKTIALTENGQKIAEYIEKIKECLP